MSKIKNGGLDQYGAEPFEQQHFETGGVEGVNDIASRPISSLVNIPVHLPGRVGD